MARKRKQRLADRAIRRRARLNPLIMSRVIVQFRHEPTLRFFSEGPRFMAEIATGQSFDHWKHEPTRIQVATVRDSHPLKIWIDSRNVTAESSLVSSFEKWWKRAAPLLARGCEALSVGKLTRLGVRFNYIAPEIHFEGEARRTAERLFSSGHESFRSYSGDVVDYQVIQVRRHGERKVQVGYGILNVAQSRILAEESRLWENDDRPFPPGEYFFIDADYSWTDLTVSKADHLVNDAYEDMESGSRHLYDSLFGEGE